MLNSRPFVRISLRNNRSILHFNGTFVFLGTASYRLMPEIILKEPIYDEDAEQLQKCFTPGVIDLADDNNGKRISSLINTPSNENECFHLEG